MKHFVRCFFLWSAFLWVLVFAGSSVSPGWAAKCNSTPLSPGLYHYTIDGQTVVVRVPSGYSDQTPTPVLLDLHGAGLNGDAEESISGFAPLCDEHNFIGVWPSGANGQWRTDINNPPTDIQYLLDVVDYIRTIANVDRSRIYIIGISEGAQMTNTMVCQAADVFAAAAPDSFPLTETIAQCRPVRPVSVMEWAGYEDPIVPYNGGGTLNVPPAPQSLLEWSQIMGCTGNPVTTAPPDGSGQVQTYETCSAGTEVGLGSIHGTHGLYAQFNIQEYTWAYLTKFTLPLTQDQLNACPGDPSPASGGGDGGGGGGGSCFIATAVYGSYLHPHVAVLKDFRDKRLLTNEPGRAFVRLYYRYSPPVAAMIDRRPVLRTAARAGLTPIVCAVKHPYGALTFAILAVGAVWIIRKRITKR